MPDHLVSAVFCGVLVLLHLLAGRLPALARLPRSIWLSAAGGVAVAYVFLHLLPELQEKQRLLEDWLGPAGEHAIYLLALAGLVAFYGVEGLAQRSRRVRQAQGGGDETAHGTFALHIAAFALYNAAIGYLLVRGERDNLLLYGIAMGLHFAVNDAGLREHHKARYDRYGRWVLAAAVVLGWILGVVQEVHEVAIAVFIALLAGGVIMNVMKEELPRERQSRFGAFLAGAAGYGLLLLAV